MTFAKERTMNESHRRKKIHINLSESLHKKLRVKCALVGKTIQVLVSELIMDSVIDVVVPNFKSRRKK